MGPSQMVVGMETTSKLLSSVLSRKREGPFLAGKEDRPIYLPSYQQYQDGMVQQAYLEGWEGKWYVHAIYP